VAAEPEVLPAEPVYQEPVYQAPVYQPQAEAAVLPTSAKILGLISMICGLVSLVSCYVGFMYSIPALILANIASKKAPGIPNGKAKVGKITAIIGIVVSVICLIAYVALVAAGTESFMEMEPFYDF
jgi:beta-lactamase regulating signal transducer with metallopeptidase domain